MPKTKDGGFIVDDTILDDDKEVWTRMLEDTEKEIEKERVGSE